MVAVPAVNAAVQVVLVQSLTPTCHCTKVVIMIPHMLVSKYRL